MQAQRTTLIPGVTGVVLAIAALVVAVVAVHENQTATTRIHTLQAELRTGAVSVIQKLAVVFALLVLLVLPGTASAQGCGASNIHGDHITAANDFQVHGGITCESALTSATGYVDSAEGGDKSVPGTETFTAEFYEWRYRWTCHTTEPPVLHEGLGAYFHCHAREELGGHRRGTVYMSFKWWLNNERPCPGFNLDDEVNTNTPVTGVVVSRNVTCAEGRRWLTEAAAAIQYRLTPFKIAPFINRYETEGGVKETETIPRYYYHYFNGGQYDCFTSPTELSENGTKELECEPEKRSWGSREYGFTEK